MPTSTYLTLSHSVYSRHYKVCSAGQTSTLLIKIIEALNDEALRGGKLGWVGLEPGEIPNSDLKDHQTIRKFYAIMVALSPGYPA